MNISRTKTLLAIAFVGSITISPAQAWKGELNEACLLQNAQSIGFGIKVENDGTGAKVENNGSGAKVQNNGSGAKVENNGSGTKVENDGSGNKSACGSNSFFGFFSIF
jgi:hypothetical protein